MTFLLDTDTVSSVIKLKTNFGLLSRLKSTDQRDLFISTVTIGELLFGAVRLGASGMPLRHRIETQVIQRYPAIPFETEAARAYAHVRANLESNGVPIGDADTRIAAIALANDLTVVTGNVRHFARVPGLRVENWLEPEATL